MTKKLPDSEKYNLVSQARRSACSICANIAEGYGRFHYQENIQYCRQARGSLDETRDHLIAIGALYSKLKEEAIKIISTCLELRPKINGYISFLNRCKRT
ncbi:MAG: four helix bundle protein [Candidatus Magasanikbacteria bacterium CG10_big_fil_rev_8_21_14_0_10_42_10]|uniref:Four helix bundle protein n=1 Tax=Candidatus Magasanikbacteria bacterium CG10_big_fil_rev_8_21_14_0_10_42_10 TaxID=1974649 RepID=A0A2H0TXX9_9BACT|nr:MAG: four helix bundle protein [Candidatus Magasanikbacteria bacterium CG10_big_fil_rev_8_21_14_0_10_42_10]